MRKFFYLIEFILIKLFFFILIIIGYKNGSNLGDFIGRLFGPIFRSKKLIENNLEQSGIVDKKNYNKIISKIYGNYGRILAEYPFLKAFRNSKLNKFIEIDGLENLNKIKREKRRAVFISGHFNNFELMALQIEKAGINLCAIYRPLNNVFLNKTMEEIRENFICKNQIKKGRSGTRQIIENIKKGNSVALMIDQRVREGIKINFFGKPASTTTIPAQLIKKYKCDLVPIYIERRKNNYFKMFVSEPIKIGNNKSIKEITEHLNKILEKMILKNVDQWIWTHDRWKT
ncbi:lysophospholipid acyltransferase family protein [Candidatus Pelagibacter sp.]|jgi:KDO2-lipid IV(A) lauroyltransferase|nr:lysophospholipid acyltransferase family protein [Candidatus Pelagibacter sp.]|tara:strand:- start:185 stop:1045 length:861 start_codon:yes stop_codon:yes gene_type:complete